MATGSFLAATERLLATLRADGCIVAAEGDRLVVEGPLTDARRAAIAARKPELLALLAIEKASAVELAGDDDAVEASLTAPQTAPRRSMLAGFALAAGGEAPEHLLDNLDASVVAPAEANARELQRPRP